MDLSYVCNFASLQLQLLRKRIVLSAGHGSMFFPLSFNTSITTAAVLNYSSFCQKLCIFLNISVIFPSRLTT